MGTRYEDQPTDHWAGPESLDPTPVWKQYLLVALLLLVGLIAVVAVAVAALAPQLAAPPALVPGDRLVLAASDLPDVGAPPRRVDYPWLAVGPFYLAHPAKGEAVAVRATWRPRQGEPACEVAPSGVPGAAAFVVQNCAVFVPPRAIYFDARGDPLDAQPPRGLDRYLVSVSGDRVIVNLSRVIEPSERTGGPVPTGIPTPQATP
jgi:hypothetical protein